MPALFVIIIVSATPNKSIELITLAIMWLLFVGLAIDGFLIGRKVEKRVAMKFGADKVERGLRWYAAMRSIQMRPMRLPKPQVKRGTKI
jgi:ABC-type microcin C transport system permease subunit YejE